MVVGVVEWQMLTKARPEMMMHMSKANAMRKDAATHEIRRVWVAGREMTGLRNYNPQTSRRKSEDWFTVLFLLKH